MDKKDQLIDILRGIAISLVIYGHVIQHGIAPWSSTAFFENPVFKFIYTFHMPLFFAISGYLMAESIKRNAIGHVIVSRMKSLFIPFIVLSVIGVGIKIVSGASNSTALFIDHLFYTPLVWFLWTLFVLSIVLLSSLALKKVIGNFAIGLGWVLLFFIPASEYASIYLIKWFYTFYLVGFMVNGVAWPKLDHRLKLSMEIIVLLLFMCGYGLWKMDDYIYVNHLQNISLFNLKDIATLAYRYFMGFIGIGISLWVAKRLAGTDLGLIFAKAGKYSLDIYIIQMFVLEWLYPKIIFKFNIHLDFKNLNVLVFFVPTTMLIIMFVSICISKSWLRTNKFLNQYLLGGR